MATSTDYFSKAYQRLSTTLSADKLLAATSMTLSAATNWPTATGVKASVYTLDANGAISTSTLAVYRGTVSGSTINNLTLVEGTDQLHSAGAIVSLLFTATHWNDAMDGMSVTHEQTGLNKSGMIYPAPIFSGTATGTYTLGGTPTITSPTLSGTVNGWITSGLPAVSSVTENGNRSADITFASTVANILTPGMRIRTSRTVAAPTYMGGAFNGTNHYFTKVTCTSTLSTVTNSFTLMAHVEPTAYASGIICGRSDGTAANLLALRMNSDGTVWCQIANGGVGNTRYVSTYQSLPLNKKTHVAASWVGGTVVIYFDGVSVPVATAVTGGTAPTTAGTGGDFSIGRLGGFNGLYFTGYISGAGAFDAVLTASTIKSYKNQVLSGSETNCIGAWSLNNTAVNQQAAGTNDLTATNSVGYTSGRSPYCTDANGVAAGTYDWAIVTKVATTVATVQYPEGCAIPTSGGISTVDYSGVKSPFGMPITRGRWEIAAAFLANLGTVSISSLSQWFSLNGQLTIPVGDFDVDYQMSLHFAGATKVTQGHALLAPATPTNASYSSEFNHLWMADIGTLVNYMNTFTRRASVTLTAATAYLMYADVVANSGATTASIRGDLGYSTIKAVPTHL